MALAVAVLLGFSLIGVADAGPARADVSVTWLTADDFTYGTYIIDRPGVYKLAEDISFNPNSPATLTGAVESGLIPPELAAAMDLAAPVEAFRAGMPLFTQLAFGDTPEFTPGGPLDARYDPAAFGVGFFAALSVTADDVTIDLNGHTIEQSAEHALLQRFFAVIELADQPFVPSQGPAGFGDEIDSARRVTITNGTIGRSSHHGVHGNANEDITITNVDFVDYEVGAVALNGVKGLRVENVTATNRKDVPVVGTFSSAQFIKAYIDHLIRSGSPTTLTVGGDVLTAADIQASLREAINNTHHDIVVAPYVVDGRAQIDPDTHPVEYAVFHNPFGLLDGNSYSFLVNHLGVAVNGFPTTPDGVTRIPSEDIFFRNVHVVDQQAFINEIVALDAGAAAPGSHGAAAIDPVGAVFQVRNLHPDTGAPITISDEDDGLATYVGNPVANAQAFVAKAAAAGEFEATHLDITRLNIPAEVVDWVEARPGAETLADIGATYLCNGDSMFHVNKGVIAFKMDSARNVRMIDTSVDGLVNLGAPGSTLCGDYSDGVSHPGATLLGYGGSVTRGYTFSGSQNVTVTRSVVKNMSAKWGSVFGYDVLTDSGGIKIVNASVRGARAGWGGPMPAGSPTASAKAFGFDIGADAGAVRVVRGCATGMFGQDGIYFVYDLTGYAEIVGSCRAVS